MHHAGACFGPPKRRGGKEISRAPGRPQHRLTGILPLAGYIIVIWIALSSSVIMQNAWILRTLQVRQISRDRQRSDPSRGDSRTRLPFTNSLCLPSVPLPDFSHHLVRAVVIQSSHGFAHSSSRPRQASCVCNDRNSSAPPVHASARRRAHCSDELGPMVQERKCFSSCDPRFASSALTTAG